jgi:hypothetical protein
MSPDLGSLISSSGESKDPSPPFHISTNIQTAKRLQHIQNTHLPINGGVAAIFVPDHKGHFVSGVRCLKVTRQSGNTS